MTYEYLLLSLHETRTVEDSSGSLSVSWAKGSPKEQALLLNSLGKSGWELVNFLSPYLIFKKTIEG